jgi:hypothetical protein
MWGMPVGAHSAEAAVAVIAANAGIQLDLDLV